MGCTGILCLGMAVDVYMDVSIYVARFGTFVFLCGWMDLVMGLYC